MIGRALALSTLVAAAGAAEHWQIDQPDAWYRADVSHHAQHGAGGVAVGALAFATADLAGAGRGQRYALAIGTGAAVGLGYELWAGRHGTAWVDPVDAAWVTAGAALGAVVADATRGLATIVMHKGGAAVEVGWRF